MDENFLLRTPLSQWLFHECAKTLPVIDYHNHLAVADLIQKRNYENLAQLWVISDPYKHRAMRICGVEEKYITGVATDREKYDAWMATLPKLLGNPLYDWSILEMKRIFNLELNPQNANLEQIWQTARKMLSEPEYSAPALLERFQVEYAAPCASITEDISGYKQMATVAPSLRGDDMVCPTLGTIQKMIVNGQKANQTLQDYQQTIHEKLMQFADTGCRFADHALDDGFTYFREDGENEARFARIVQGEVLSQEDRQRLVSHMFRFLAAEYAARGWTMQLHIGAKRGTSTRLRTIAGPAGGFAGIGRCCDINSLTAMLDDFEQGEQGLPYVLLYTLNPADNAAMAVLSGSYSEDKVPGKVQLGPAWWWCDHLFGIRQVFDSIASFGVLSTFIGMTTDSRSILSFVRHEYFRRILCGWIGDKVEQGELPASRKAWKRLVEDVCYNNAKSRLNNEK